MSELDHRRRSFWLTGGKRGFDLVTALLLLIMLLPLLVATAILIKLTSRGPILFSQVRAGQCARPFRVIKFRTMRGGRRPDPKEIVPLDHPEITTVGRMLRRIKIDELPQLWNVVRGDMSLVGPRPTLPDQVAQYDKFRRRRLEVRPGLTGLAQVNTTSLTPWDERILYDVAYVARCGPALDAHILVRTIGVLLLGEERWTRPFTLSPYARLIDIPPNFPDPLVGGSDPQGPG